MSHDTIRAPSAPELAWSPHSLPIETPMSDEEEAMVRETIFRRPTAELIAVLLNEYAIDGCALGCGEPAAFPAVVCASCMTRGPKQLERQQAA